MQASGNTRPPLDRNGIAATERLIRRYVRHTAAIFVPRVTSAAKRDRIRTLWC